ncbi:hypothetical protein LV779_16330 [Streptomyces thinghirensis]|nr:hypothetical protein [Streptomyces thinghirensis]
MDLGTDFDEAMTRIRDRTGPRLGQRGMYGVMYLYDLYMRQERQARLLHRGRASASRGRPDRPGGRRRRRA